MIQARKQGSLQRKIDHRAYFMNFVFVSLGCAKNLVDSEALIYQLQTLGHTWVSNDDDADLIIINTCSFIGPAKEESIETILEYGRKKKKGRFKLLVGGCLPQRFKREMPDLIPEVDGWFGVEGISSLQPILEQVQEDRKAAIITDPGPRYDDYKGRTRVTPSSWAYLKIAEGCSHRCSFCVIPSVRGPYRSREINSLLSEASNLVATGCRELILIAQDTGLYGIDLYGKKRLVDLLEGLNNLMGLQWIRILYMNPETVEQGLLDAIAKMPRIVPYLDIPFQHGSQKILRMMQRWGNRNKFREIIEAIRERIPGCALRSSFIVGFPGETERDFQELLAFLDEAELQRAGFFTYSSEEGTAAYGLEKHVSPQLMRKRYHRALSLQKEISLKLNKKRIGTTIDVLLEKKRDAQDREFLKGIAGELGNLIHYRNLEKEAVFFGRSIWDAPEIDGRVVVTADGCGERKAVEQAFKKGDIIRVKITQASAYDVIGHQAE
jgi:ribosomal protein S12 methylthiotransferase